MSRSPGQLAAFTPPSSPVPRRSTDNLLQINGGSSSSEALEEAELVVVGDDGRVVHTSPFSLTTPTRTTRSAEAGTSLLTAEALARHTRTCTPEPPLERILSMAVDTSPPGTCALDAAVLSSSARKEDLSRSSSDSSTGTSDGDASEGDDVILQGDKVKVEGGVLRKENKAQRRKRERERRSRSRTPPAQVLSVSSPPRTHTPFSSSPFRLGVMDLHISPLPSSSSKVSPSPHNRHEQQQRRVASCLAISQDPQQPLLSSSSMSMPSERGNHKASGSRTGFPAAEDNNEHTTTAEAGYVVLRVATLSGITSRLTVKQQAPLAVLIKGVAQYLRVRPETVHLKHERSGLVLRGEDLTEGAGVKDAPSPSGSNILTLPCHWPYMSIETAFFIEQNDMFLVILNATLSPVKSHSQPTLTRATTAASAAAVVGVNSSKNNNSSARETPVRLHGKRKSDEGVVADSEDIATDSQVTPSSPPPPLLHRPVPTWMECAMRSPSRRQAQGPSP